MPVELAEVRRALEDEELVPYFQPLLELRTGLLKGFEVLARWEHETLGAILPENFVSLAEENGLIELLTHQIVRKAFRSAMALPEPLTIAINISPIQLNDPTFPAQLQRLAEDASFPLRRLTIEVTESGLLGDLDQAATVARELKALGCQFALDDFGTGYSNLNHLQAVPFDQLKIDRSFVASMTKTRESRKIVASIAGLAQSLGIITVAEGVETEEQAYMLVWLGCDLGQGWLYGRPAPESEIPRMLAAEPHAPAAGLLTPGDDWAVSSLEALPAQRLSHLQAIYDGSPVGLCFLDCLLRYVSINRRMAEMSGASVSDHLGKTVPEMLLGLFPSVEPYLLRALKGEAIADVEVLQPSATLEKADRVFLWSYQPAWDEADEVIGISIAVEDVTEKRLTEQALQESLKDLRHLEELNEPIPWVMDAKGKNLQTSSQWVPTNELSRKKMRNLGWLEALNPDDLETTMKTMAMALRTGKPIDIEYRVRNLDGEWKWVRSQGSPRFGPSGEIIRWYGSVQDVDDLKRAELDQHGT